MSPQYSLSSKYLISAQYLFPEYLLILIFLITSFLISCLVFGISYLLSVRSIDREKISAYECGFNPFEDARNQFDVRFYLVAILFIIFLFLAPTWGNKIYNQPHIFRSYGLVNSRTQIMSSFS